MLAKDLRPGTFIFNRKKSGQTFLILSVSVEGLDPIITVDAIVTLGDGIDASFTPFLASHPSTSGSMRAFGPASERCS